tara:strand:- start:21 stop:299 length:279 start_codon:yes stop_codon:yes gene_type:complete
MLIKLVEVKRGMRGGSASLGEIYINSSHIVSVSQDLITSESLINESSSLGLVSGVEFSKIIITEGSQSRAITVVGSPAEIYSKVKKRQILRG